MSSRRRVTILCPTRWDELYLLSGQRTWEASYDLQFFGTDIEASPETFDAIKFIEDAAAHVAENGSEGVVGTGDYPGCIVAAAVANRLGLRGPSPESVLKCSHKYYARLAQSSAVPDVTPDFALINPLVTNEDALTLAFPLFVKPVKSNFSKYAQHIGDQDELRRYLDSAGLREHLSMFVRPFNDLLALYGFTCDAGHVLAEQVLPGPQVTLEGFVYDHVPVMVGLVDSVKYAESLSFKRFNYPTCLDHELRARMWLIARRMVKEFGLNDTFFNIEFAYDPVRRSVHVIEINPRMSGQFAGLFESVDGVNPYEVLLAISTGNTLPPARRETKYAVATSFAMRSFRQARVVRVPQETLVRSIKGALPVTAFVAYYRQGQTLSQEPSQFDGYSYRYAILDVAGESQYSLEKHLESAIRELEFDLVLDPG